jgi:hypothetical protein
MHSLDCRTHADEWHASLSHPLDGTCFTMGTPRVAHADAHVVAVEHLLEHRLCAQPEWIRDSFKAIAYQFTKVTILDWFLENKIELLGNDWYVPPL